VACTHDVKFRIEYLSAESVLLWKLVWEVCIGADVTHSLTVFTMEIGLTIEALSMETSVSRFYGNGCE